MVVGRGGVACVRACVRACVCMRVCSTALFSLVSKRMFYVTWLSNKVQIFKHFLKCQGFRLTYSYLI